ncbi:hypothetical protein FRC07_012719, partial [Ceratobasidium sp. 392]
MRKSECAEPAASAAVDFDSDQVDGRLADGRVVGDVDKRWEGGIEGEDEDEGVSVNVNDGAKAETVPIQAVETRIQTAEKSTEA